MRFRDFSELLFIRFAASERSVYELSILLAVVDDSDSVAFCWCLLMIEIQYVPVH